SSNSGRCCLRLAPIIPRLQASVEALARPETPKHVALTPRRSSTLLSFRRIDPPPEKDPGEADEAAQTDTPLPAEGFADDGSEERRDGAAGVATGVEDAGRGGAVPASQTDGGSPQGAFGGADRRHRKGEPQNNPAGFIGEKAHSEQGRPGQHAAHRNKGP